MIRSLTVGDHKAMRLFFLFLLLFTFNIDVYAQQAKINGQTVNYTVMTGTSEPSSTTCDSSIEVGGIYVRTGDPASVPYRFYACKQTGASSYAWSNIYGSVQTTAPAKCEIGDLWFDSNATAGSNLYFCTATDTWTVGSGSGGTVTAGTGIIVAGSEVSVDTAVIQSRATLQAGVTQYCRSTTGNDTYTCSVSPALTTYTRGGCLILDADAANDGAATLDVDTLGVKSILNRAGGSLSSGDITANKPIGICYDGTQFIIQGDGGGSGGGTPGGSDRQIQFNNSGSFGGATNAVYNSSGYLELIANAIGTTLTERLRLINSTAATSDQDQNTPSIHLMGTGWNAVEARSEIVDYWITGTPTKQSASGPSRPQPGFEISYAINGGAKGTLFHMYQTRNAYDSDFPMPNYFLGLFAGNQSTITDGSMANFGIGTYALNKLTSGNENMAFGNSALYECTTCYWNTAVGNEAGIGITTGYLNTFIGQDAGRGISLVTTTKTGNQNTHIGTQAGPATPNQVSNSVAIGYQASVFGSNQGVLGNTGQKWAIGGYNNPDKTLVVADPTTVGTEVLDAVADADWDGYTDFSVAGDNCAYTHSTGSGTCKTFSANYNATLKGNRLYRVRFTLSNHGGNPLCVIQNIASSDVTIGHTQPTTGVNPNGTWDILLRTATSPGDFTIYCTSDDGTDTATFDDISLREILDGDLDVNKDITAGGNLTSSNIKRGSGTPEGAVVGAIGDIYQRTNGSTGTTIYIKESGTGNTGWVAVAGGGSSSTTLAKRITFGSCDQTGGFNFVWTDNFAAGTATTTGCPSSSLVAYRLWSNSVTNTHYIVLSLPENWNSGSAIDMKFRSWMGAGSGNVRWDIATKCYADAEDWTVVTGFNTAQQSSTLAYDGTNNTGTATLNSVTTTGCAAGETMVFRIERDNTVGSNLAANANILEVIIKYGITL